MESKLTSFWQNNWVRITVPHLAAIVLFGIAAFVTSGIPKDALVAGGDFFQATGASGYASNHLFTWNNAFFGQGTFNTLTVTYPYYAFFGLLQELGLSSGQISNTYLFIFLYGSFLAAYFGVRLVFPTVKERVRFGLALIYALNPFVITVLTYPWGYSHHFIIYPFLPLLIGYYHSFLTGPRIQFSTLLSLLLTLLVAQIAFNNLAFLAVLLLLKFLLLVSLLVFKKIKLNRDLGLRILWLAVAYLVVLFPLFLTNQSVLTSYSSGPAGSEVFGSNLKDWLSYTSSTFLNVFMLTMDRFRFPWVSGVDAGFVVSLYVVVPAVLLYFMATQTKKDEQDRNVWVWLILLLGFLALSVRLYSFMTGPNTIIYQLPFFTAFRSPDKIFVLLPLLLIFTLAAFLTRVSLSKRWELVLLGALLLSAYPFFDGTIKRELAPNGENGYRYIITTPEPYLKAQETINQGSKLTSVVSLPFSVVNSYGWSNYPAWGFVGADILAFLYEKSYISANMSDNIAGGSEFSFRDYNNRGVVDVTEFRKILQSFSTEYIFWHKDINQNWTSQTKTTLDSLNLLRDSGELTVVDDNEYFSLYKMRSDLIAPTVSVSTGSVTFKRVNPTHYLVNLTVPKGQSTTLQLNQTFHPEWRVLTGAELLSDCSESIHYVASQSTECKSSGKDFSLSEWKLVRSPSLGDTNHQKVGSYANEWQITSDAVTKFGKANADGTVTVPLALHFKPQGFWVTQAIFNVVVLLVAIAGIIFFRKKHEVV